MISSIRRILHPLLKRLVRPEILWLIEDSLRPSTFGQLGEDAVIHNHLGWLGLRTNIPGAYLDIGAHHPTRGSNTAKFYRRGSRGFAVDFGSRKEQLWAMRRPRDIFINAAVVPTSFEPESITVSMRTPYGRATDSIVPDLPPRGSHIEVRQVPALKASILSDMVCQNNHWSGAPWRFISIDVEGFDEAILRDLDLSALGADVIAIEVFLPESVSPWAKIDWLRESPIVHHLTEKGYSLQSICGPTLIFVRVASYCP